MTIRQRVNFISGKTSATTNAGDTTVSISGGWPVAIPSGYYVPITLNPASYGSAPSPASEIVYVNGPAASGDTTVNVTRGQENTAAATFPSGTTWVHSVSKQDFTLPNAMVNGDFPTPTGSGQFFQSTSTSGTTWVTNIPTTSLSGNLNATTVTGSLSAATLPVAQIVPGTNGQFLITQSGASTWSTQSFTGDGASASYSNPAFTVTTTDQILGTGAVSVSGHSTYICYAYIIQDAYVATSSNVYMTLVASGTSTPTIYSPTLIVGRTSATANYLPTIGTMSYIEHANPTKSYAIKIQIRHSSPGSDFQASYIAMNVVGIN